MQPENDMICESPVMRRVLTQAQRYAGTSATVLITGESGTGKELLARYLHEHSVRQAAPCIRVNCASFQESLADSELFGHEQGAFTGALRRHDGCIMAAGNGTLFLDEIGELPVPTQAKLLRVLEENEYHRVGSTELLQMKARIIAATNRDLQAEVAAGRFREDLFHRLDVLTLQIPPLRERPEEIRFLVQHFINRFGSEGMVTVTGVTDAVRAQLEEFHWPGNVRQLRNVIHRACVVADSPIIHQIEGIRNSPAETCDDSPVPGEFNCLSLKEIERRVILARLDRFKGNKTEAAAELGVTARTLRNKIAEYRRLRRAG